MSQPCWHRGQTPTISYYDDSTGGSYTIAGSRNEDSTAGTVVTGADVEKLTSAISGLGIFRDAAMREKLLASLPWAVDRPQPTQRVSDARALTAACCARLFGLEALIDACERLGATDLPEFADDLDAAHPTHAIRWSEGIRLRAMLLAVESLPSDEQAKVAYHATPAGRSLDAASCGMAPKWAKGRVFLFEILRLAPQLPIAQSLFAFLATCRPHGDAVMGKAIDRWREQVEKRLREEKIEVVPVAPPSRVGFTVLQIQFQPLGEDRLLATPWWRTGSKLESTKKLFDVEEIAQDDWPAIVTRAFEEALERRKRSINPTLSFRAVSAQAVAP